MSVSTIQVDTVFLRKETPFEHLKDWEFVIRIHQEDEICAIMRKKYVTETTDRVDVQLYNRLRGQI